jgi:hypothetical protein
MRSASGEPPGSDGPARPPGEPPGSPRPPPLVRFADRPLRGRRWLLIRGRGDRPLDARVDAYRIRRHSSSKRPSVQCGDEAILYAAVWQALFGIVDVVGDPENDPDRERWAWTFPIRPVAVIGDLHDAPPVEAAGVFPQSLWRHSHIRLSDEQFRRASELISAVSTRG